MHDTVFAGKIIGALKETVKNKESGVVVDVVLGPFTHVTKESLIGAFNALNEKEGYLNVSLNVRKNRAAINCRACWETTEIDKPVFACPICGSTKIELVPQEEFVIEAIKTG